MTNAPNAVPVLRFVLKKPLYPHEFDTRNKLPTVVGEVEVETDPFLQVCRKNAKSPWHLKSER